MSDTLQHNQGVGEAGQGGVAQIASFAGVPYLEQYFGVWAMAEDRLHALHSAAIHLDLAKHMATRPQEVQAAMGDSPSRYRTTMNENGIAVVSMDGTLMKQASSLSNATSTVRMRQTMRSLARDESVRGVMLKLDSPGGTVAGNNDLAEEIAALAAVKPVAAYADSLTASAAYWLASQADTISAGKDALVGSIGTYAVAYDMSGAAAKEGVKVHVIRAGDYKGAGVPGTEFTDAQRADLQRTVNALNAHFLQAVANGRGMSMDQVQKLADGRVHVGDAAKQIGLVDHVESFDAAMNRLSNTVNSGRSGGTRKPAKGRAMISLDTSLVSIAEVLHAVQSHLDEIRIESNLKDAGGCSAGINHVADNGLKGDNMSSSNDDAKSAEQAPASASPAGGTTAGNPAPATPAAASTPAPAAATMAELRAGCPKAPDSFLVEAADKSMTVAQAKDAYISFLVTGRDASDKIIADQKTEIAAKDAKIAELTAKSVAGSGLVNTTAADAKPATAASTEATPSDDPKATAKAEWAANANGCQQNFINEKVFVAFRSVELQGHIKSKNRK